jgi:hypothetical protein
VQRPQGLDDSYAGKGFGTRVHIGLPHSASQVGVVAVKFHTTDPEVEVEERVFTTPMVTALVKQVQDH